MNGPRSITLRGGTLVELLVDMAIIGVLVALLVPAVQSARRVSRPVTTANQPTGWIEAGTFCGEARRHDHIENQ